MQFCGVPENIGRFLPQNGCQWPRGHVVSVSIQSAIASLGMAKQEELTDRAFDAWRKVCGLNYRLLPAGQPANIEIHAKQLDGPSGVLAQALLPCGAGPNDRNWQQYDSGENWAEPGAAGIDYLTVCIHETGHSLGWGHAPAQSCIMYAAYSGPNTTLCDWEIDQATSRYGQPGSDPPEPPPPDEDDDGVCDDLLDCLDDFLRYAHGRARLRQRRRSQRS